MAIYGFLKYTAVQAMHISSAEWEEDSLRSKCSGFCAAEFWAHMMLHRFNFCV